MLCQIADLIVEVPEAGGMALRCRAYQIPSGTPDVIISTDDYRAYEGQSPEMVAYMESGAIFYSKLMHFDGMLLHSAAIEWDGKAYLFSGPSGVGKSTHTRQWKKMFGEKVVLFNDDKPALRYVDGQWFAYGTPWCGKDGIHQNRKVPLGGICFLKQAKQNAIRPLPAEEAVTKVMWQSIHKFERIENLDRMLTSVDKLVRQIPMWELENLPGEEAVLLAKKTMCD